MPSKGDNIEMMINDKADELIEELFESFLNRYQIGLQTSMRVSDLIFDCVHLFYYKCHKINFKLGGGSYIGSPDLMKNKKATINPTKKNDNKCFQYAITIVLNHKEIKKDPHRITTIKPFINKYNWEEINYSSEKSDWKKVRKIT